MAVFIVVANFIRNLSARLTLGSGDKCGEWRKHFNQSVIVALFVFGYQSCISDAGAMAFAVAEVIKPSLFSHAEDVVA